MNPLAVLRNAKEEDYDPLFTLARFEFVQFTQRRECI